MNNTRDGGPAFPRIASIELDGDRHNQKGQVFYRDEGVTLRDYFAAKAIPESIMVAADQTPHDADDPKLSEMFKKAATYAYFIADAMLAERAK